MNVILIGPPGSGKGTQAFVISEKFNLEHISTGDLFRNAIKNETPLGLEVKDILKRGEFVSDELTFSIVEEAIQKTDLDFMLDGYPRTVNQAELLANNNHQIDAVLYFNIDENLLIERLTGRRVCKECGASYHVIFNQPKVDGVCDLCSGELYQRNDDNAESAQVRLTEYFEKTAPVIGHYKQLGVLFEIDAAKDKDLVFADIEAIFKELK